MEVNIRTKNVLNYNARNNSISLCLYFVYFVFFFLNFNKYNNNSSYPTRTEFNNCLLYQRRTQAHFARVMLPWQYDECFIFFGQNGLK